MPARRAAILAHPVTVTVHLPEFLRRYGGGAADVAAHGATVGDVLADLFRTRPDLRVRVVDAQGAVFPYLLVFRNGDEVPRAALMSSALADGDRIEIVAGAEGG
jgi:sulfur-carrier protein